MMLYLGGSDMHALYLNLEQQNNNHHRNMLHVNKSNAALYIRSGINVWQDNLTHISDSCK